MRSDWRLSLPHKLPCAKYYISMYRQYARIKHGHKHAKSSSYKPSQKETSDKRCLASGSGRSQRDKQWATSRISALKETCNKCCLANRKETSNNFRLGSMQQKRRAINAVSCCHLKRDEQWTPPCEFDRDARWTPSCWTWWRFQKRRTVNAVPQIEKRRAMDAVSG